MAPVRLVQRRPSLDTTLVAQPLPEALSGPQMGGGKGKVWG